MLAKRDKATLHRYFIWANRMREHLDETLKTKAISPNPAENIEVNLYMSLWYSQLYAVIEGWKELQCSDSTIEELLKSPNMDLLRRYRNGVCNFQKEHFDARFIEYMTEGQNSAAWIRTLNH